MTHTILIADSDLECRRSYLHFLNEHGCAIEMAADGLECLAKLRQAPPGLLILDLHLRWGGGDGILDIVRCDRALQAVPVVLTSAAAFPQIEGLLSPPVIGSFVKPVPPAVLQNLLGEFFPPRQRLRASAGPGILVVDDDAEVRHLLRACLQVEGFRVWAAGNGAEALQLCREYAAEIAVILLDVQMPGVDGPQTLANIRQLNDQWPVCFITADAGSYEPSDLLRRGALKILSKPFRMDELARVVRQLAGESGQPAPCATVQG